EQLHALTSLSAEIERMSAESAFRFGAAQAYEAIVAERIDVLRETRLHGRQTMREFMLRRYKPAMRTCRAAERRLAELSDRAARIANLLRTRVDVGMTAQNQALLESMDRRAALQLRLQETVEGLSVVAISYYAVSLGAYMLAPVAKGLGVDKPLLVALIVVPVVLSVWGFMRRVKKKIGGH
ncbi:MAG: putative membrane-anchored protein, partial [Paracoccaceae bacterium]